jgi:hypothetical protein
MILKITGGETIVDEELYPDLSILAWHVDVGYAVHNVRVGKTSIHVLMHRHIFLLKGVDIPSGMEVDHINRNRLDNRFENFRIVTRSQNMANSIHRDHQNRVNGYIGVVCIREKYYYGRASTYLTRRANSAYEAAVLRDELAIKLHGDCAILNFPNKNGGYAQ